MATNDIVVRPKRQVTLPKDICQRLGIETGDTLEITVVGATMVARPKKTLAMEALNEIREAFKRSGVTEEQLLEATRVVRHPKLTERQRGTKT
ncbi:MAG: AbrB/MazE/SpoVT family DNA-binding domain-containing protein [Dehalococcoidales bacterium]|nr:AbrB/MazE/SpoVT family DNA-binding domain-containing protein [Dehalococcoidales bacterium]